MIVLISTFIILKHLAQRINYSPQLLRHLGHSRPLEPNPRIPLHSNRLFQAALILRLARIRIRQVLNQILGSFLVHLLRDDNMPLSIVLARLGVYPRYLLDEVRFGFGFTRASSTPGALDGRVSPS